MTASHRFAIQAAPVQGLGTARCSCGERWPIAEPIAVLIGLAVEHNRAAAITDATTGRVLLRTSAARSAARRSFQRGTRVRTAEQVAMALLTLHDELPTIGGMSEGRTER
jgi:hypothetical protein